jgi:hypothetical protein
MMINLATSHFLSTKPLNPQVLKSWKTFSTNKCLVLHLIFHTCHCSQITGKQGTRNMGTNIRT